MASKSKQDYLSSKLQQHIQKKITGLADGSSIVHPQYYKNWNQMSNQQIIDTFFPQEKPPQPDKACMNGIEIKRAKMSTTWARALSYDEILLPTAVYEDKVKVTSHNHMLKKHGEVHHDGWRCDFIKGTNRCLSGMTDFYQARINTPIITGYRCTKCDFDMCWRCLQADLFIDQQLKNRED